MVGEESRGEIEGSHTCLPIMPMQAMQGVDIPTEVVGNYMVRGEAAVTVDWSWTC